MRDIICAATAAAVIAALAPMPGAAAELLRTRPVAHHRVYEYRDECGCLHWSYVYHRQLRYTYGSGFDPRSFDETEPYFYRGPVRRYVRFW